jgi:hypothetical protein
MRPNLIVMLTHNDQTVENALEVFEGSKNSAAEYWGFKDVGLPVDQMKKLVANMNGAGKKTCLEVVRYTEEECLESAKLAMDCNFDFLMGTLYYDSLAQLLKNKAIQYMPFCGQVRGRPSVLEGSISEIINEAKEVSKNGANGFDLLAYRYIGDPEKLAREFVKEVNLPVVIAGSISSFARLDKIKEIGPWGFTIGSAFFEKKFGDLPLSKQIDKVVSYVNR